MKLESKGASIRYKLVMVVMLTTLIALLVASAAIVLHDLRAYRLSATGGVSAQAALVAGATSAALDFADREVAGENLSVLRYQPQVDSAAVYDARGALFATYTRDGDDAGFPELPGDEGVSIQGSRIIGFERVIRDGTILGSAYVSADYDPYGRLRSYAGIVMLVALGALFVAALTSMWLQRVITRPILSVAEVARHVVDQRDYSERVRKSSDDEVGVLVDAFNDMLREIEHRDEALRNKEAQTRAILESALDSFITMDHHGRVLEFNPAAERAFGYSREDVIGEELAALIIPPEDRGKHREGLRRYLETGEERVLGRRLEMTAMRADGSEFPIEQGITRIDSAGAPVFTAFISDITARKQAEAEIRSLNSELEQRVQERTAQLEQANRELESFSYSVSHDLRGPLRAIDGFSEALVEDLPTDLPDQAGRYLDRIRAATLRMGQLIDDLLNLSKVSRADLTFTEVDLSAIATDIVRALTDEEPDRCVEVSVWEEMTAAGDARLLRVALENLIGNAWKFTRQTGTPRIEVGCMRDGEHAVYFVRDNGAGFDMKYAEKLFGAFQRLHHVNEYPGTGIGLATVQRIVHRHGGRVWADAALGRGAIFYFSLTPLQEGMVVEPPGAGDSMRVV